MHFSDYICVERLFRGQYETRWLCIGRPAIGQMVSASPTFIWSSIPLSVDVSDGKLPVVADIAAIVAGQRNTELDRLKKILNNDAQMDSFVYFQFTSASVDNNIRGIENIRKLLCVKYGWDVFLMSRKW